MPQKAVTSVRLEQFLKKKIKQVAKDLDINSSELVEGLLEGVLRGDIIIEPMKMKQVRPIVIGKK